MAHNQYKNLSSELWTMICNALYDYPDLKSCGNGLYCLVNHSLQPRLSSTTSIMLSINRHICVEIIMYLLYRFDIYLIHGRVAVCLRHNTQRLYSHPLALLPSMRNTLTSLKELWIVAGQFSFPELKDIVPYLHNLTRVNLEHDMTNETAFTNPNIFLVDYCNGSRVYHYPPFPAQVILISESKQILETQHLLSNLGYHNRWTRLLASILASVCQFLPRIGIETDLTWDLRWFLTTPENRAVPGVRIVVHLRCPMKLCETCAKGGKHGMFRVFEKKMTIRYDFDTSEVLGVGWVEMK